MQKPKKPGESSVNATSFCPQCGEAISLPFGHVMADNVTLLRDYPYQCFAHPSHPERAKHWCQIPHEQWRLIELFIHCPTCQHELFLRCVYIQPCNRRGYIHSVQFLTADLEVSLAV